MDGKTFTITDADTLTGAASATGTGQIDTEQMNQKLGTVSRAQRFREMRKKRETGVPFTLSASGGAEVLVKPLSMVDMIMSGRVPQNLQAMVDDLIKKSDGQFSFQVAVEEYGALGTIQTFLELSNITVLLAVVDPKVVPTEDDITDPDNQISLDEIDPIDRIAIWRFCQGQEDDAAAAVRPFPVQSGDAVVAGSSGEAVRSEAI